MKCFYLLSLIVSLSSVAAPSPAYADGDMENWGQGVVNIFRVMKTKKGVQMGSGTGFVLNKEGYIATNNHVIANYATLNGKPTIYINPDGGTFPIMSVLRAPNAEVIWHSDDLDLAILKYTGNAVLTPVPLTKQIPDKAQRVVAVGYPGAAEDNSIKTKSDMHSDATVTSGVFSKVKTGSWGGSPLTVVQHSAQISWGNSGGPLFDECRRVIGVNTRLTFKNAQIAPGVFFASGISELTPTLDNMGIAYTMDNKICISAADKMAADQMAMKDLFRNALLIGGGAFILLGSLTIFALRRPRERVVRMIETASRSLRARPHHPTPNHPPAPAPAHAAAPTYSEANLDVILDGQDSAGYRYHLAIPAALLSQGAVIGREPPNPDMAINHPEVSRQHARIFWQDGFARLQDTGSTNGTKINGRAMRPRQEQVLAHGDVIEFGNIAFRVTLRH